MFRFADTALGAGVRHGRHAVAVDERRADFTPTLWDADPRIKQTLFPGSHGDVGGGYPDARDECGLSDLALEWISAELSSLGVLFATEPGYTPHPDPAGILHEQWLEPPWDLLPRAARAFPAGLCLGQSVIGRINAGPVAAKPEPAPRALRAAEPRPLPCRQPGRSRHSGGVTPGGTGVSAACCSSAGSFGLRWGSMLYWALVFLIIAIVAGALGFGGLAATAGTIAHILFVVFLVFFVIALIGGLMARRTRPPL